MDLISQIRSSGVVGAGGAGFPTYIKLNAKAEYLIINAAECEPLLQTDQFLMRHKAMELVGGILLAKKQTQADKAVIAVKGKYTEEIAALKTAIQAMQAEIEIFEMQNFYPAGDEQIAVFEVTGRSVPPGGIPLNVGCIVSNVATIINVFEAAQDIPVTHKYLSILGHVKTPRIIKTAIGTRFSECLAAAGGTDLKEFAIIRGGPMMGGIIGHEELDQQFVKKTDGAMIVIPADHSLVSRANLTEDQIIKRAKACIQCRQCTELCPRHLIGHDLQPHRLMRAVKENREFDESCAEALLCSGCGVCEVFACPMGIEPRQINFMIAKQLRAKGIRYSSDDNTIVASPSREHRRVSPPRLVSRLELNEWDHQHLHETVSIEPVTVEISTQQHIGAASEPCVSKGDSVQVGQVIAAIPEGKMGSTIHASINGSVVAVDDQKIIIKRTVQ